MDLLLLAGMFLAGLMLIVGGIWVVPMLAIAAVTSLGDGADAEG